MGWSYSAPANEAHLDGYSHAAAIAFARTREQITAWVGKVERADVRVLVGGAGGVGAGLLLIPMGQFFGGRSVPMVGVAGVAVAPEHRGRGAAGELMRECVRELAGRGVALSALYPATQALYRSAGYESAGSRFEYRLPLGRIGVRDRGLDVRSMLESDREAIRGLYRDLAADNDGWLDRGPYVWGRVFEPGFERAKGYVVAGDGGRIEAWTLFTQANLVPGMARHELRLADAQAITATGGRRLLAFLASFSTTATDAVFYGGPWHPLLGLMDEQPARIEAKEYWMVRLCDLPAALRARGYPHGLRAELHLDVHDPVVQANAGTWVLEIGGEVADVRRGGRGDVRVDVAALAALYAGFMPPQRLAQLGRLEAPETALRTAAAVFAPTGGTPAMPDFF